MNTIANETTRNKDGNSVLTLFKNSRLLQVCTAVLLAQVGFAVLLSVTQKQATFTGGQTLFTLQKEEISHITIDDAQDSVELKKQGNHWSLQGDSKLPVDKTELDTLLGSLVDLKAGLPVASSIQSRTQLDVADDQYQRRLVVNEDANNRFLIGSSPGLRKAHLRREGANEIYSANLSVSDLPASIDHWLDKSLLQFNDVSRISSSEITFERDNGDEDLTWQIDGHTDAAKTLDTEKLESAIRVLESLRVIGLHNFSVEPNEDDTSSDLETVELDITSSGTEHTVKLERSSSHTTIARSDIDQTFTVAESVFDQLAALASDAGWLLDKNEETDTGD